MKRYEIETGMTELFDLLTKMDLITEDGFKEGVNVINFDATHLSISRGDNLRVDSEKVDMKKYVTIINTDSYENLIKPFLK